MRKRDSHLFLSLVGGFGTQACLRSKECRYGIKPRKLSVNSSKLKPGQGWCLVPGVKPVFLNQEQAISYAQTRASFRSGEIRILDSTGEIERTISFSEANRKL
jgi:hypothetical protein